VDEKTNFATVATTDSYTTNNCYIGFKRIVHDALNPGDDAPPLPNPSTWFPADPALHPSTNTRTRAHANNADADDDLAIASERISIKCPLTLLPYKDPVTSTKCPHSFEKSAILDMIARSAGRVGGERAVKCPVCEMVRNTFPHLYTYMPLFPPHQTGPPPPLRPPHELENPIP